MLRTVSTACVEEACHNDSRIARWLEVSPAGVFISCDFSSPLSKYGNRGYRFGLMEAGAAMQNVYLYAAERGLATRAIGGFNDPMITDLLGLNGGLARPLLLILIG
ncbi:MAG: nitroreductase family protein [Actinomycetota bacterium]|nr:nitroreductase family protein [Actinomycetota bacterium]